MKNPEELVMALAEAKVDFLVMLPHYFAFILFTFLEPTPVDAVMVVGVEDSFDMLSSVINSLSLSLPPLSRPTIFNFRFLKYGSGLLGIGRLHLSSTDNAVIFTLCLRLMLSYQNFKVFIAKRRISNKLF